MIMKRLPVVVRQSFYNNTNSSGLHKSDSHVFVTFTGNKMKKRKAVFMAFETRRGRV